MNILFEDNHLIIINKQVSEIVQGDKTGDRPLSEVLQDYLKTKYDKPGNVYIGVAHRLDRPTTGVLIFAKTSKMLSRLNTMFQNYEVKKTYWAVVNNKPPKDADTLNHYLVRDEKKNKSFAYDHEKPGSKKASLSYKLLAQSDYYYLLEIELHTGRHHQIRAQLARINCRIKGDVKYGFPRTNPNAGIHLHARQVSFIHPVKNEPITIIAPPPDDVLWNEFVKIIEQKS